MTEAVLGIETTCDETSAAVLDREGSILGLAVHSQDMHRIYGGVIPELAARDHLRRIEPVVSAALGEADVDRRELGAVAVAACPGLIGALLVGVSWARAVAMALGVPYVPVHHMEGHLFAPILEDPEAKPPFVALLVSGGHTMLLWVPEWGDYHLMGETRDDAVGEAFDKVARILGLPYPGGPGIEAAAASGDPTRFPLPRPLMRGVESLRSGARRLNTRDRRADRGIFDFSFSGLKTAVARTVAELEDGSPSPSDRDDIAAAFQEAAVEVLASKTLAAVTVTGCARVLLGGGVAANRALRDSIRAELPPDGRLFAASPRLSMDNGAMIARAGLYRLESGDFGGISGAVASAPLPAVLSWYPKSSDDPASGPASEGASALTRA